MPRVIQSFQWDWTTDAGVRAAFAALKQACLDAGLVQTADTGQADVSAVVKPTSSNTDAGYLMFRFADPLQSVAPVFIRVTFGSGNTATYPRWTFRVGTGSDGAGNLIGMVGVQHSHSVNAAVSAAGTTIPVYATHSSGFFGLCFGPGLWVTASNGAPGLFVQRTCDNTGSPTAEGVVALAAPASATSTGSLEHLQFLPTQELITSRGDGMGFLPWLPTRPTFVGLAPQAFNHFVMMPKCKPLVGTCGFRRGETALGQTFPLTMVGTVPRTYISLGQYGGNVLTVAANSGNSDLAMLWED